MDEGLKIPLRDIHLPAPVSWWPPAPGWWALLALALLMMALVVSVFKARGRRRMRVAARVAYEKLSEDYRRTQDARKLIENLSVLLRRVCLSYLPREEAAALTGERWLELLETGLGRSDWQGRFKQGPGRVLISAPYRAVSPRIDAEGLLALCGEWIRALPPLPAERRAESRAERPAGKLAETPR